MDRQTVVFHQQSCRAQYVCSSGRPKAVSTLTNVRFCCANYVRDATSGILRKTNRHWLNVLNRKNDAEDDDDAAEEKAAREGPVAACGRGHQDTEPASEEPKACREAKLFEEHTVFVDPKMGRVKVHKTSASRESSVRRMMEKLTVHTHDARFLIKSRGAGAWHVDGVAETQAATCTKCRRSVYASPR